METSVIVVQNDIQLQQAFIIRKQVFIEEQGVPESEEIDKWEHQAVHFLALYKGKPGGTARLRFLLDGTGKVERVAVLKSMRGNGLGHSLMQGIEDYARQRDIKELKLHAQVQALDFYRKSDYKEEGAVFLDAGIEHMEMRKKI